MLTAGRDSAGNQSSDVRLRERPTRPDQGLSPMSRSRIFCTATPSKHLTPDVYRAPHLARRFRRHGWVASANGDHRSSSLSRNLMQSVPVSSKYLTFVPCIPGQKIRYGLFPGQAAGLPSDICPHFYLFSLAKHGSQRPAAAPSHGFLQLLVHGVVSMDLGEALAGAARDVG